ncbi:MAG TPA: radical SAM protein [Candidatus Bathyarchaeota archaeon]|nr:radical SAM protein [Candidatus Bathyarchaeota archaeon]
MIAFGPVPSRRLGKSLGINNIPAKVCTYSCVYCQLGRTKEITLERRAFYDPDRIFRDVRRKVEEARTRGEEIDYLTFVPDGEPTLDLNLGVEIELLRRIEIPIAILTNASLLWRRDVEEDLLKADLVSVKVDAVSEGVWRRINRPHKSLKISEILDGISEFSKEFKGKLITETMLINGLDYTDEAEEIADFLSELKPYKAYVAIPTRPPAEKWVKPAEEEVVNKVFQIFSERLGYERVEYLIGYEGSAFVSTGDIEDDILSIASVHPIREEGMRELLRRAGADWSVVERLLDKEKLLQLKYEGHRYYLRKFKSV